MASRDLLTCLVHYRVERTHHVIEPGRRYMTVLLQISHAHLCNDVRANAKTACRCRLRPGI